MSDKIYTTIIAIVSIIMSIIGIIAIFKGEVLMGIVISWSAIYSSYISIQTLRGKFK